jgi:hypothetical protein
MRGHLRVAFSISEAKMTRRIKLFLYHVTCSFIIIATFSAAILAIWFPVPYRSAAGGVALLLILASVDIVLGPLMTLFLAKNKKDLREIVLDLCVIALVQLGALAYGVHSIFIARPVHTVFEIDRFKGISANDVITDDLPSALPEFRRLPVGGPTLISADKAPAQTQTDLMNSVNMALGGFDISSQPKRWVPYANSLPEVLKRSKPASLLVATYPELSEKLKALAKSQNTSVDQLRFLPMVIHKPQWTAVLSPDASQILDYYHVDGFIEERNATPAKP